MCITVSLMLEKTNKKTPRRKIHYAKSPTLLTWLRLASDINDPPSDISSSFKVSSLLKTTPNDDKVSPLRLLARGVKSVESDMSESGYYLKVVNLEVLQYQRKCSCAT